MSFGANKAVAVCFELTSGRFSNSFRILSFSTRARISRCFCNWICFRSISMSSSSSSSSSPSSSCRKKTQSAMNILKNSIDRKLAFFQFLLPRRSLSAASDSSLSFARGFLSMMMKLCPFGTNAVQKPKQKPVFPTVAVVPVMTFFVRHSQNQNQTPQNAATSRQMGLSMHPFDPQHNCAMDFFQSTGC